GMFLNKITRRKGGLSFDEVKIRFYHCIRAAGSFAVNSDCERQRTVWPELDERIHLRGFRHEGSAGRDRGIDWRSTKRSVAVSSSHYEGNRGRRLFDQGHSVW